MNDQKLTEESKEILDAMTWGDHMAYQHFLDVHKKNVQAYGKERLEKEVMKMLKKLLGKEASYEVGEEEVELGRGA